MTDRIYYTDPYCRSFRATVTRSFEHDGRPAITLDRTAFYPTSGGQPFDNGQLGGADVIDVIDDEAVIHILSSPLSIGATVGGEVNWARRFDHMQQHTGQHLLSAALDRLFENPTVSFHMGAEDSTVDVARDMSPADVERAVDVANEVIWDNRPIAIRFVTEEEARTLALRKDPARGGVLRLIEISDFDLSACGGTHVSGTGAVGTIAVLATERHRGGMRLTFVCGRRAVCALRRYRDVVVGSVRVLSVLPGELPFAIERMQVESKRLEKQIRDLRTDLAGHEGRRLAAAASLVRDIRVVVEAVAGCDAAVLKAVASAAAAAGATCAALVTTDSPPSLVIARSPGVPVEAHVLLRELVARFGGRGGGRADLAQGGGFNAPVGEIAAAARQLIESQLRNCSDDVG
jgi:alanyl-tRNA synthetase